MVIPVNHRVTVVFQLFARNAGIGAIIIGLSVLIGWATDSAVLKSISPRWQVMWPVTALCFVLHGVALVLLQRNQKLQKKNPVFYLCTAIVALIGMMVMCEQIFGLQLSIDKLLFKEKIVRDTPSSHPGRMAFFSAVCFLLTSTSLVMADLEARSRRHAHQYVAITVTILSFMAILDYFFWASDIYDVFGYSRMAFHSALAFLLLSSGVLVSRPECGIMKIVSSDTSGGKTIRSLFPKIILTLMALTELRYIGQQFGYYDADFGSALSAVFSVVIISYILLRNGKSLAQEDLLRKGVEKDLRVVNKSLIRQKAQLEASNRELEQFAYIASHDLQEPLKTISNYSTLFEAKYKGTLDKNADTYLGFLMRATTHMKALVKDLLNYSRAGGEKNISEVDCNKLLQEVLIDMDASIRESNAVIEINPLPLLHCYRDIKQLFQHLISNAIKYRNPDIPLKIVVSATTEDDKWLFSVKDNGIGIEKAYSERIFALFQKLDSKEKYPGTGIGLALCKKIAELHDGKIWVESEPGKGSTFYFTISKHLKGSYE